MWSVSVLSLLRLHSNCRRVSKYFIWKCDSAGLSWRRGDLNKRDLISPGLASVCLQRRRGWSCGTWAAVKTCCSFPPSSIIFLTCWTERTAYSPPCTWDRDALEVKSITPFSKHTCMEFVWFNNLHSLQIACFLGRRFEFCWKKILNL